MNSPRYLDITVNFVLFLLVYFACVLYYLGLWAAVSVVSTLSFQFITCDLENVMLCVYERSKMMMMMM